MSKIWCNETGCWYNRKCRCRARDVYVYEDECITCRYEKPEKGKASRDPRDVQRDRAAKKVSDKIMADMLERMNEQLKNGGRENGAE